MLRGQLVVPLQDGEYRTGFGKTISYRRDVGLQILDTESVDESAFYANFA